ncbi:hypothetical protein ACWEF6_21240 [Amycolatopsis sp. NPDC004772]
MTMAGAVSVADDPVRDVLMSEYEMLKGEQKARIVLRDRLMYATFAALAAVVALNLGGPKAALLLLLPPVCIVLGWTYLVNDEQVSAIGTYLRDVLGPALGRTLGGVVVLRWETEHRRGTGRVLRKSLQLGVDLLMFLVPSLVAVGGYWLTGPVTPGLVAVSLAELGAAVVLGVRIVGAASLTGGGKN